MKRIITIFICGILLATLPAGSEYSAQKLLVYYLDVGQADCEYIELPDGRNILIDAGNNADGPLIVNFLKGIGVTEINYLFATHPHEDHIGGIDDIIDNFEIDNIYSVKIADDVAPKTLCYSSFLEAVKASGCKIKTVSYGMKIIDSGMLQLECLSPDNSKYNDLNAYSAVLRLKYGKNIFLFMGDAVYMNEISMLNKKCNLDCDVLKVGHHGSSSSTSMQFLRLATPKYAVISVGADNSYDHPSPAVIRKLDSSNAISYRTDIDGTCVASGNGKQINMYKYNICLDGDR